MDLRDFVAEAMARVRRETLRAVEGATLEDLNWRPGPEANPVGFLLWHIFRVEDAYFHRWIQPVGEVWEGHGWHRRLRLVEGEEVPPQETGFGWPAERVARFVSPPLGELLAYGNAVRQGAMRVLRALDLGRLGERPRPDRPDWTVATLLQNAVIHEAHHQGAIAYLLGLRRSGLRHSE